ncbi:MAG: phosphoribosylaminoimidazolesuccinocarboxamide synthase [Dethiobacter sp.]|jgi:phosphoribosylaminoimidazole-succinocarboxamide synthase|nr:MAG: phosphoribosylaminoimidazolesuccinocarboxamide synthase [Dethiobacter sp.]
MGKKEFLYEGKAKKIYGTPDPDYLIVEYKDTATAFDGLKKENLDNKGVLNNKIAAIFFELLEKNGISTHFVKNLSDREMLVKNLEIIPVEVIVRNIVAGSLSKRLGVEEGTILNKTVLELNLKNDELHDPMLNHYHVYALDLASPQEMAEIEKMALRSNEILKNFLLTKNIVLVDFKLEFGRHKGEILLGDEISPDTCRFWDAVSGKKMDKDRFRRDLGGVTEAYQEVLKRLQKAD